MVKLEKVKKQYKDFELDCSMEIKEGWITGLVGQNGAGKSTAFKAMLGLIRSDSGKIEILGKTPELLGKEEREQIGVVMAGSGFNGYLSINDLIPIFDAMYQKFDKAWFLKECEKFKLPLKKKIKEFSTGMNRKLQILAALSHDAKLLILDEPTAGLDPKERVRFRNLISSFSKDKIVLLSTHIVSDVEYIADEIFLMKEGQILQEGTPEEITAQMNGLVWECEVDEKRATELECRHTIVNMKKKNGAIELRIVSDTKPDEAAISVDATLEDMYLYYFKEDGNGAIMEF